MLRQFEGKQVLDSLLADEDEARAPTWSEPSVQEAAIQLYGHFMRQWPDAIDVDPTKNEIFRVLFETRKGEIERVLGAQVLTQGITGVNENTVAKLVLHMINHRFKKVAEMGGVAGDGEMLAIPTGPSIEEEIDRLLETYGEVFEAALSEIPIDAYGQGELARHKLRTLKESADAVKSDTRALLMRVSVRLGNPVAIRDMDLAIEIMYMKMIQFLEQQLN
jgi:hypothetical protein